MSKSKSEESKFEEPWIGKVLKRRLKKGETENKKTKSNSGETEKKLLLQKYKNSEVGICVMTQLTCDNNNF